MGHQYPPLGVHPLRPPGGEEDRPPGSPTRRFHPVLRPPPALRPVVGAGCNSLYCSRSARQLAGKKGRCLLAVTTRVAFLCDITGREVRQSFPVEYLDRIHLKAGRVPPEVLLQMARHTGEPDVWLALEPSQLDVPSGDPQELCEILQWLTWHGTGRVLPLSTAPADLGKIANCRRGPAYRTPDQKIKDWKANKEGPSSPFRQRVWSPPEEQREPPQPEPEPASPEPAAAPAEPDTEQGQPRDAAAEEAADVAAEVSAVGPATDADGNTCVVVREGGQELGITFDQELVLETVTPGSPAERAGMRRFIGYPISHVQGTEVQSPEEAISRAHSAPMVTVRFGSPQRAAAEQGPLICRDAECQASVADEESEQAADPVEAAPAPAAVPAPAPAVAPRQRGDSDAQAPQVQVNVHLNFIGSPPASMSQTHRSARRSRRSVPLLLSGSGSDDSSCGDIQPLEMPPQWAPAPPQLLPQQQQQQQQQLYHPAGQWSAGGLPALQPWGPSAAPPGGAPLQQPAAYQLLRAPPQQPPAASLFSSAPPSAQWPGSQWGAPAWGQQRPLGPPCGAGGWQQCGGGAAAPHLGVPAVQCSGGYSGSLLPTESPSGYLADLPPNHPSQIVFDRRL
eukprot:TRINITY_DN6163_c0_g1_i1.p1 TRINITY_DN6163_c0_g1~~TRINITY_DN6163_c0_g1_i1.p1  ORF type:complete len:649 (+),score=169.80 TRINITY_DN6163_c0_g1_i1:83-1948(+)